MNVPIEIWIVEEIEKWIIFNMKIFEIKQAATNLNPQEMTAIKQVCQQLKSSIPGIGSLLQNTNNLTFLMKFLDIISQNPSAVNQLKNAIATIHSAMQKDQTATVTFLGNV